MESEALPDESFAAWLRRRLAAKGWTRDQLKDALGHTTDRTVYRWLKGENTPRGATLRQVERALDSEWTAPPPVTATSIADELVAVRRRVDEVYGVVAANSMQLEALTRQPLPALPGGGVEGLASEIHTLADRIEGLARDVQRLQDDRPQREAR